jgi:hypothetical protein
MSGELLDSERRTLLHVVRLFVCLVGWLLAVIDEYYTESLQVNTGVSIDY